MLFYIVKILLMPNTKWVLGMLGSSHSAVRLNHLLAEVQHHMDPHCPVSSKICLHLEWCCIIIYYLKFYSIHSFYIVYSTSWSSAIAILQNHTKSFHFLSHSNVKLITSSIIWAYIATFALKFAETNLATVNQQILLFGLFWQREEAKIQKPINTPSFQLLFAFLGPLYAFTHAAHVPV